MTPEIELLAKGAGLERSRCAKDPRWLGSNEQLAKFAALIAEECAKECEGEEDRGYKIAAAIRAKFALSHEAPEAK